MSGSPLMTASLVATSSPSAFFLGLGELAARTVATESAERTDSMDTAATAAAVSAAASAATFAAPAEDLSEALVPALEDLGDAGTSGASLETGAALASSRDGAVVVFTRVPDVSGVVTAEEAGPGVADVVLVAAVVRSLGLLVAGADVVAGADAIVGFTYTQVSCAAGPLFPALALSPLAEPVLASASPLGASAADLASPLALDLSSGFASALPLIPGLGLVLPLLPGGRGGFPARGLRLLFFRKTGCCLLAVGAGPFFGAAPTLLFFRAGDCSRDGAGDFRGLAAGGRGIRDGEGWASSFVRLTLDLRAFFGDCGLTFFTGDTEARRCCPTDFFLVGEGSRDTGWERGILDLPAGGGFLCSVGEETRMDLADPGSWGWGLVRMTKDAFLWRRVGDPKR